MAPLNRPGKAKTSRSTNETSIEVSLDVDGTGQFEISTGIGFFDHMLEQLSKHSLIDSRLKRKATFILMTITRWKIVVGRWGRR